MRLLNTQSRKPETFGGKKLPTYAILSHRWGESEMTLQDLQHLEHGVGEGYDKVRRACEIAKAHEVEYIWIDTCCIDKTSSAELSEAINSMYRWYRDAGICYAYLADVPPGDADGRRFAESEWFRRGWTLQELIAPSVIIFFDQDWNQIGTKSALRSEISGITGIPDDILRGSDLESASIAQRMSWASQRETERVEDAAYCLMGIFGVNMPMLYGEGERAFVRLQEEIMRVSDDHSIFAWESASSYGGLLASSPHAFRASGKIVSLKSSSGPITINNKGIYLSLRFATNERPALPFERFEHVLLPCVEQGSDNVVAIYVRRARSDTDEFFERPRSRLLFVNLDHSSLLKYAERSICIQGGRRALNDPSLLPKVAGEGHGILVKLFLLERGADATSQEVQEALLAAVKNRHEAVARLLLLERGADLTFQDSQEALLAAAQNKNEAVLWLLLLERGADLAPQELREVLLAAVERRHEAVLRLLLGKGADLTAQELQEASWAVVRKSHEAIERYLPEKGIFLNSQELWEFLLAVMQKSHVGPAQQLLEKVTDPVSQKLKERVWASGDWHDAVIELLLKKGVGNIWNLEELIMRAVNTSGYREVVQLLLEKEAGLNLNFDGAITRAAKEGDKALEILLGEVCLGYMLRKGRRRPLRGQN